MGDDLTRRAINALLALRTLSEVSAVSYDREQSSHTAESTVLVRFTKNGELAPAEPSLFDHHRGRINDSRTRLDLELRVLAAEEALRDARKRSGAAGPRMAPEDTRKEVLALFDAGWSVAEIAHHGGLRPKWVLTVLKGNGRAVDKWDD